MSTDSDRTVEGPRYSAPRTTVDQRATDPAVELDPFPLDVLPEVLQGYVRSHADALGVPPQSVAVPLLAALAGVVGNARRVQLKRTWTEPSVVWTAIVGLSGTLKSPARDVAIAPLRRIEAREQAQHRTDLQQHKSAMFAWEAAGRPVGQKPEQPIATRLIVSDTTTEALSVIMERNPRGVLLERDELRGWLGSFDEYKAARGSDEAFWLQAHRASAHTVDRKGNSESIFIPHLAVSVTGTIQPQVLARMLGKSRFESGLAARLLLVMPPMPKKRWSEDEGDESADADVDDLFSRLRALEPEVDGTGTGTVTPVVLPLSPHGRSAWQQFYDRWNAEPETDESDAAAANKLEAYAARFALVLALARDPETQSVSSRDVEAGAALAWWFRREIRRVYDELGASNEKREQAALTGWIQKRGGEATPRDLQRSGPRHCRTSSVRAYQALERLVSEGLGRWERKETGGRPVKAFRLFDQQQSDV